MTENTQKKDFSAQIKHLCKSDPVLGAAIKKIALRGHSWQNKSKKHTAGAHFKELVVAIINQQLSGKAADTIQRRFEELFAAGSRHKKFPTPEMVLKVPAAKLRKVGLSKMKVSFIKDLAKKVLDGTVDFKAMPKWSDEEVVEHLMKVKGIGRWTAEMFLMFSLGRDDVFSYGDLGLRNAIMKLYRLRAHPTPRQAEKISAVWRPYRTLASWYLWKSLEVE